MIVAKIFSALRELLADAVPEGMTLSDEYETAAIASDAWSAFESVSVSEAIAGNLTWDAEIALKSYFPQNEDWPRERVTAAHGALVRALRGVSVGDLSVRAGGCVVQFLAQTGTDSVAFESVGAGSCFVLKSTFRIVVQE